MYTFGLENLMTQWMSSVLAYQVYKNDIEYVKKKKEGRRKGRIIEEYKVSPSFRL